MHDSETSFSFQSVGSTMTNPGVCIQRDTTRPDYRHSSNMNGPANQSNSVPSNVGYLNRSASIPISRSSSEYQLDLTQEQVDADDRDFVFYTRVVEGISRKRDMYESGDLKYETGCVLNRIVQTRHEDLRKAAQQKYIDQLVAYEQTEDSSDDLGGIFELDL